MNNICFLLGAGFSHAITDEKLLLTKDLMDKIKPFISSTPELQNDFDNTYSNIELFITLLDVKIQSEKNDSLKDNMKEIKEQIKQEIIKYYDIDKLDDNYPLCESFIKKIPQNAYILTLNYDCVLDKYLWLSKRWSPEGGYIYPIFPRSSFIKNSKLDGIKLLKLHGSCNFRNDIHDQAYFKIEITPQIFPNCHSFLCDRDGGLDAGPHVLVMSYLKNYHNGIMWLWRKAINALKNADKLIIIGCSLRNEDLFLRFALYHFGMKKNVDNLSIEIIDKDKSISESIKSKIEDLAAWPNKQKYTIYNNIKDYL